MGTGALRRHYKQQGLEGESLKTTPTTIADVLPADPPNSVPTDPVKIESKGLVPPKITEDYVKAVTKKEKRPEVKSVNTEPDKQ